jgi:two-component system phosphate regulon sensor histidine kinase PhoR
MGVVFKKTYRFAFKSSLYLTLVIFILSLLYLNSLGVDAFFHTLVFAIFVFILSFFIIQYRVEHFIYRRIKKIYDDVALIEQSSLKDVAITTDLATLTKEVKKFAIDKKLEIEALNIREEYRREFLGNISHELKTPLFSIQGYLSTLIEGAYKDKNILLKYLERAEKGVERLIFITRDLDMIAKLEAGNLHLEYTEFDIIELIQGVLDLYELKAQSKGITLDFDMKYTPVEVNADREKIQQVISNLIDNSIKYSKPKGSTEISIEEITQDKILVRITDNGLGIEKHLIPRLFERFFRIDKTGSREVGGTGLGLSIVKHIIEAHKEKIYVESQHNIGSEFSFTLTLVD